MSIDLVIGRDHGKGAFRASIKIYDKFTLGRNTTRIFRLAHVQCKNYNGGIMGNTFMYPIWYRIKNICAVCFLGWTQFIILPHGCPLTPPTKKSVFQSGRIFFTGDLAFYDIVLGKEVSSPYWLFDCMLDPYGWRYQGHLMGIKWNIEGLKPMYKKKPLYFQR